MMTILTIEETQANEEFHIDSQERAEWYLRKLANLEAEKGRISAQAQAMIKRLDSDAEGLKRLFEAELADFVRQELAASGGRRRSIIFFNGTCAFRTVAPSLRVANEAEALSHVKAAGLPFVETFEKLDANAYRKLAAAYKLENGEDLPGIEWSEGRESFSVNFGKGTETE